MTPIEFRKEHAPWGEKAYLGIEPRNPFATRMIAHKHDAKRAGRHYDFRFLIGNRAVSFATRYGLPGPNEKRLWIRQPDHAPDYMDFEGEIPKGQFGEGKVGIAMDENVIVHPGASKIDFTMPDGKRYVARSTKGQQWLVMQRKELKAEEGFMPRFKEKREKSDAFLDDPKMTAQEKIEGWNAWMTVQPHGNAFQSVARDGHRAGKEYTHHVPQLRDLKTQDKWHGWTFNVELFHPKGIRETASILGKKDPTEAVLQQKRRGPVRPYILRVGKAPGMDASQLTEKQHREYAEAFVKDVGDPLVRVPKISRTEKRSFCKGIIGKGGEGCVLMDESRPASEAILYKYKLPLEVDLKVVGVTPGEGQFAGRGIGALIVEDAKGKRFKVGSGMTHSQRLAWWQNRREIVNRIVKVRGEPPTKKALIKPRFVHETDKARPDDISKFF